MNDTLNKRKALAKGYFNAFHRGEVERIYSYFNKESAVKHGVAQPIPVCLFFLESKGFIETLAFETHGVYVTAGTNDLIKHFSFSPKTDKDNVTEAIDIINFDDDDKISKIKIITNSK